MFDPLKLYGTDEPPNVSRQLVAGPLAVDLSGGNLRTIRFAGHEVLRSIAYVVRDRDWGTYDPMVSNLRIEEEADRFAVRYDASCRAPDGVELHFQAQITGDAAGRLSFRVEAETNGAFETNRCGFCVLHPIEGVAGTAAEVIHTDGSIEHSRFPDLIEPWQPFKDMRAISHEIGGGLRATCLMEGDTFEMEDQRAWSDASYKTYVRPLALPWPYVIDSGEKNVQTITVTLSGEKTGVAATTAAETAVTKISLTAPGTETMPRFGLAIAPSEAKDAYARLQSLQNLAPQFLLFHFDVGAGHDADTLATFAALADALPRAEIALELVIPASSDPIQTCRAVATAIEAACLRLDTVVVGPDVDRQSTPPGSEWPACPPLDDFYFAARRAFPNVRLGGGMFSYFTELNRKRVPLSQLDFVTHAMCPIVHAADDLSVMQTLEAIPFITRSTRSFIGLAAYRLGPTTIGMRQNPYGSRTMPNPDAKRIAMASDDPRARGLFGAAWLVGYASRLAGSTVEAWCGTSFAGERGLFGQDGKSVPMLDVVSGLISAAERPRLAVASSDRSRVDGFSYENETGQVVLWLANLTSDPQSFELPSGHSGWRASVLDTESFDLGAEEQVSDGPIAGPNLFLRPYAIGRLVSDIRAADVQGV